MTDLESLRDEQRAFVAERDWTQFHDPKNLAMLVASEAGELVGELRWVPSADADAFARAEPQRSRIAAEVADVTIAVLLLADRMGLDLVAAVRDKLAVNRRNYPPALVRGSADRPPRGDGEG
jgi:NTP pyrophosphatase (non-canonical NTP hydrolase)